MFDHRYHDDLLWHPPRERLDDGGRLSHLVFVDGRLVDAWSERVEDSAYADVARRHDEDARPQVVQSPPPLPRHVQALHWLDCVAGSREELLAMTGIAGRAAATAATTSTRSRTSRGWSPTSCSPTCASRCSPADLAAAAARVPAAGARAATPSSPSG